MHRSTPLPSQLIFSFAHLEDGENSWITDKCQGPLPPPLDRTGVLHRPYITPTLNYTNPQFHQPILHLPSITMALNYTGPILQRPYITPALDYTSPKLHRPYITSPSALYYTGPIIQRSLFAPALYYNYYSPILHWSIIHQS